MSEHMFDRDRGRRDRDAVATTRVAELSERLLDELAGARHDWPRIRRLSAEITRVASSVAEPPRGRSFPHR